MWLQLLKGLVGFASYVAKYMSDKQLIEAGHARAINRNLKAVNVQIDKAISARSNVKLDANSVQNDPNNRANRK